MLSEQVDATLSSAFWDYKGTDLQRRSRAPTILRVERLGVPTYNELVFAARRRTSTPRVLRAGQADASALARGAGPVRATRPRRSTTC